MVLELAVKAGCQSIITYNTRDFAGVEQCRAIWGKFAGAFRVFTLDRKVAMSIVQVQIPDSLQKSLHDLASRDGISIDQFISSAIAEKLSSLMTENYLKERAKRSSRLKYEAILAKVPDVEPEPYDRLLT